MNRSPSAVNIPSRFFTATGKGYANQKNFAIDQSSGEWVLSLDADEPVEPALADEIRAIISSLSPLTLTDTPENVLSR